jgi:hypothetical protein
MLRRTHHALDRVRTLGQTERRVERDRVVDGEAKAAQAGASDEVNSGLGSTQEGVDLVGRLVLDGPAVAERS